MSDQIQNRKNKLMKASQEFEESLNDDLTELSDAAVKWGSKALLIGGGMLASYLIFKFFFSSQDSNTSNKKKNKFESGDFKQYFLKSVSDKAALIVLELLREFLIKRIGKISEENE